MYESEHFTTFFPLPPRRYRVRDFGVSSMYNLTNPKGELLRGLSAFEVRASACAQQFQNRLRPDHIDDIDLVLAIGILQGLGWDIQPAR